MVDKIRTIYVKELNNLDEIFKENSKLPIFLKKWVLLFKKIFCVVTIKENGVCVLPYQNLETFFMIKRYFIKRIFLKLNRPIVLSNDLANRKDFRQMITTSHLELIEGMRLSDYLIPEILDYICKMTKEEKERQEITLLITTPTANITKIIIELAQQVKRIQIVTTKIGQFKRIENELQETLGVACQITSNKRKSLLKSNMIINFNYSEEQLNQYAINPNAIIVDINQKTHIASKAFCGIHIYDYQMNDDSLEVIDNAFERKKIYEARLLGKTYEQIRKTIKEENARIINLIGRKGIIHREEYIRTSKKMSQNT